MGGLNLEGGVELWFTKIIYVAIDKMIRTDAHRSMVLMSD
jgi:hypothetical protein